MPKRKATAKLIDAPQDEEFYAGVRALLAEIPTGDDVVIITLKGHLVLEQLLIQAMESAAHDPGPIKSLDRLQYSDLPPILGPAAIS